ncbi:hypothetical protein EDD27_7166 [Nonomuraea polychroma]|uniref:Uncharacterized protein n=1 Tax=Nonomuraea polychroma TaxID=46176 RepID=A0A438MF60_9ACTN|nr:hypothetical protein EDD27_7166 [Nonomuraea polychroma]
MRRRMANSFAGGDDSVAPLVPSQVIITDILEPSDIGN